ncbi:hypothetical protein DM860_009049 [Cuscuta australis]|uniref:Uncharacterized protein n=1 Tax=Cuscuta australis TaxID=267555 RepID=A0A328D7V9_9ASTE|nr:hypothetical protein DM860_009049 [Cuscuta australis]
MAQEPNLGGVVSSVGGGGAGFLPGLVLLLLLVVHDLFNDFQENGEGGEGDDHHRVSSLPVLLPAERVEPLVHIGNAERDHGVPHPAVVPAPIHPVLVLRVGPYQQGQNLQSAQREQGDPDVPVGRVGYPLGVRSQLHPGAPSGHPHAVARELAGDVEVEPRRIGEFHVPGDQSPHRHQGGAAAISAGALSGGEVHASSRFDVVSGSAVNGRDAAGDGAVLPDGVEPGPVRGEEEGGEDCGLPLGEHGGEITDAEAETPLLKLRAVAADCGGVGADAAVGTGNGHQALRPHHPGSAEVERPGHPGGGGDASVAVRDVGGVVARVVGPVEEGVEHREADAAGESGAVGEDVIGAVLGVRGRSPRQGQSNQEQNHHPTTLTHPRRLPERRRKEIEID